MARRKSVFREVGLSAVGSEFAGDASRRDRVRNTRLDGTDEVDRDEGIKQEPSSQDRGAFLPQGTSASTKDSRSMMYRFGAALLFLGALVSLLQSFGFVGRDAIVPIQPVSGGTVPNEVRSKRNAGIQRRAISATDWCFKWAQQSAIVNGTLYLYGGQIADEVSQTESLENTWTNNFISIDLTKGWETGGPPFTGLEPPSDVPAVALGYLFSSTDSLFLYGGEYSWKPPKTPAPFSTWEYKIADAEWVEHSNPVTTKGLAAPDGGVSVQRAAEGAGVNIPTMGRGFYLGGHLDTYTTPGWDISIARVYLKSMLEYTFPGFSNDDVSGLSGSAAGDGGAYRNITQGGIQNSSFTARADGILTFVPGYGDEGVLIALAGGTNETFTQMYTVNVYDIATNTWYNQATSGAYPDVRVNPCSVVAAAADGSSYNIYMFGGQDLLPYGTQKQKDDMWILSIPSFIWIKVDQGGQSTPPGRSGATCNIWDAQMVMVGGYLGNPEDEGLTCEYPATFVFDLSSCIWQTKFTPLAAIGQDNIGKTNDMNQQPAQLPSGDDPGGLEGSYGYKVPKVVQQKIGGNDFGGATITKPTISATGGPFKTGSPIVYITETGVPKGFGGETSSSSKGRTAAIVVGVVCGLALILIGYLIFCLFVYRKQLKLYKRHVEMSQAQARGEKPPEIPGLWATDSAQYDSDQSKPVNSFRETGSHMGSSNNHSHGGSGGQPGSALGHHSGTQSARRSSEVSSTEDLLADHEPTFVGVMLNPRRSLRVINRD